MEININIDKRNLVYGKLNIGLNMRQRKLDSNFDYVGVSTYSNFISNSPGLQVTLKTGGRVSHVLPK